ncbi:MAG: Maf family protein, partial [Cyanobacteria bacterium P01_A01_bin.135]
IVLGCDSVLVVAGEVCGKPETPEVAIARWQQMRGRQGTLLTGHALLAVAADPSVQPSTLLRHQVTQVSFANVSDPEIEAYVATGEPLQCAGAFALDGRGSLFVEQITGCYSNVIGLSLPLLREMLADLGYDALGFWSGNTEGIPASS